MAKLQFVKDTTSQTVPVFIQDSSSTVGAGLTGLTSASGSLTAYYYREGAGTGATAITLAATGALGTWESGGFFEVDATNMPGWYELGIPNAALATGADFVGIQLKGAANMAPCNLEIQLTGMDLNDATDGGMASVADWTNGGRLDLILDIIAADTTTDIPALIAALNNLSAAQVNAEVVDALATDTYAEPAQGAPGATISLSAKINYLFKAWRNKFTTDATDYKLYNDDAATVDHKATLSDNGTTYTKAEVGTGP